MKIKIRLLFIKIFKHKIDNMPMVPLPTVHFVPIICVSIVGIYINTKLFFTIGTWITYDHATTMIWWWHTNLVYCFNRIPSKIYKILYDSSENQQNKSHRWTRRAIWYCKNAANKFMCDIFKMNKKKKKNDYNIV